MADLSPIVSLEFLANIFTVFVRHDDDGKNLKVCMHRQHIGPYCLHSRYLFLRWIVSEAQDLHGDGSPQIRRRNGREGGG